MPDYELKDADDRMEVVRADNVDRAFEIARERGMRSPRLISGGLLENDVVLAPDQSPPEFRISVEETLAAVTRMDLYRSYVSHLPKWTLAGSVIVALLFILEGTFWGGWGWLNIVVLIGCLLVWVLPAVPIFVGPVVQFHELERALAYHDFQRAGDMLTKLEGTLSAFLVAGYRAKIAARQGRRDEALRLLEPFAQDDSVKRVDYLTQVVQVMNALHDGDGELGTLEQIIEEGGDRGIYLLDMARLEALRGHGARAKELFAEAQKEPLPSSMSAAIHAIEGIVSFESSDTAGAIPLLEGALEWMEPRQSVQPQWIGFVTIIRAYLALAHQERGETALAIELWTKARPFLNERGDERLIRRGAALGG